MADAHHLEKIEYLSPVDEIDPENDNVDIHIHMSDGRVYSLLVATPKNIDWCMDNEGNDYFFSDPPPLFVRSLDRAIVERAVRALITEYDGGRLSTYAVLQEPQDGVTVPRR